MPKLPSHGWFFRCEVCNVITSREALVCKADDSIHVNVCLSCRHAFIRLLERKYKYVFVIHESVGIQIIYISERL